MVFTANFAYDQIIKPWALFRPIADSAIPQHECWLVLCILTQLICIDSAGSHFKSKVEHVFFNCWSLPFRYAQYNLQWKSNASLSYAEILGHDMFTSTAGHFHSGLTYQDYINHAISIFYNYSVKQHSRPHLTKKNTKKSNRKYCLSLLNSLIVILVPIYLRQTLLCPLWKGNSVYVSWDNILLQCWLIVVVAFFLTFYDLFLPCESFSKHDDFARGKIEDERFSIS